MSGEIRALFTGTLADLSEDKAALESPNFSGTPSAPTATPGTSSAQLATTAFVAETQPHLQAFSAAHG